MYKNNIGAGYPPAPYYNNPSGYSYNPTIRFQNNYIPQQQFSGYGLISTPTMYQSFGTLGYNPNMQQQSYYNPGAYQQYAPGNNMGGGYYNPYMQQQQLSGYTYTEYGYNPSGGTKMYSSEDADKIKDILDRMSEEQREYQNKMSNVYPGYNYYGYMMNVSYNPYIAEKYKREVYVIEQEAIQRKIEFNKRLSRIAHTYLDDDIDEDYYDNLYDPRDVQVSAEDCQLNQSVNKLSTFTVNVNEVERNRYNAASNQISQECNSSITQTHGLIDFLNNAGILYAESLQNDILKIKHDKSKEYNRSRFSTYLASQLENRDGTIPSNLFPSLTQTSSIMEDGTLHIKPPSWMTNAKKESEKSYEENKARFINAIYNGR